MLVGCIAHRFRYSREDFGTLLKIATEVQNISIIANKLSESDRTVLYRIDRLLA